MVSFTTPRSVTPTSDAQVTGSNNPRDQDAGGRLFTAARPLHTNEEIYGRITALITGADSSNLNMLTDELQKYGSKLEAEQAYTIITALIKKGDTHIKLATTAIRYLSSRLGEGQVDKIIDALTTGKVNANSLRLANKALEYLDSDFDGEKKVAYAHKIIIALIKEGSKDSLSLAIPIIEHLERSLTLTQACQIIDELTTGKVNANSLSLAITVLKAFVSKFEVEKQVAYANKIIDVLITGEVNANSLSLAITVLKAFVSKFEVEKRVAYANKIIDGLTTGKVNANSLSLAITVLEDFGSKFEVEKRVAYANKIIDAFTTNKINANSLTLAITVLRYLSRNFNGEEQVAYANKIIIALMEGGEGSLDLAARRLKSSDSNFPSAQAYQIISDLIEEGSKDSLSLADPVIECFSSQLTATQAYQIIDGFIRKRVPQQSLILTTTAIRCLSSRLGEGQAYQIIDVFIKKRVPDQSLILTTTAIRCLSSRLAEDEVGEIIDEVTTDEVNISSLRLANTVLEFLDSNFKEDKKAAYAHKIIIVLIKEGSKDSLDLTIEVLLNFGRSLTRDQTYEIITAFIKKYTPRPSLLYLTSKILTLVFGRLGEGQVDRIIDEITTGEVNANSLSLADTVLRHCLSCDFNGEKKDAYTHKIISALIEEGSEGSLNLAFRYFKEGSFKFEVRKLIAYANKIISALIKEGSENSLNLITTVRGRLCYRLTLTEAYQIIDELTTGEVNANSLSLAITVLEAFVSKFEVEKRVAYANKIIIALIEEGSEGSLNLATTALENFGCQLQDDLFEENSINENTPNSNINNQGESLSISSTPSGNNALKKLLTVIDNLPGKNAKVFYMRLIVMHFNIMNEIQEPVLNQLRSILCVGGSVYYGDKTIKEFIDQRLTVR